jgi:hypothetical protein
MGDALRRIRKIDDKKTDVAKIETTVFLKIVE